MYFDQLANLYDQYTVIGARAVFKISQAQTTNSSMAVTAFINDDISITPSFDDIAEISSAKHLLIPAGSNNSYTLTLNWSSKKAFLLDQLRVSV